MYVNTAQEFDGSDAGARPDEAVSWGKIKAGGDSVKVRWKYNFFFGVSIALSLPFGDDDDDCAGEYGLIKQLWGGENVGLCRGHSRVSTYCGGYVCKGRARQRGLSETVSAVESEMQGVYAEATVLFPLILAALHTGLELGKCTSNHLIGPLTEIQLGVGGVVRKYSSKETHLAALKSAYNYMEPRCADNPRIQIRLQPWEKKYDINEYHIWRWYQKRDLDKNERIRAKEFRRRRILYSYKQHPNAKSRPVSHSAFTFPSRTPNSINENTPYPPNDQNQSRSSKA